MKTTPQKLIAVFGVAGVFVICLAFARITPQSLAWGALLFLLGVAIRLHANATVRKDKQVCRVGTYAFSRHPMYVGTMIACTGLALIFNHPSALLLVIAALVISVYRARKEEAFLGERFPDYRAYRDAVPVVPRPWTVYRVLTAGDFFAATRLAQCYRNGELPRVNLYLTLFFMSGLYLRANLRLVFPDYVYVAGALLLIVIGAVSWMHHPPDVRTRRSYYPMATTVGGIGLGLVLASLPPA